jgi:hypothetical protein
LHFIPNENEEMNQPLNFLMEAKDIENKTDLRKIMNLFQALRAESLWFPNPTILRIIVDSEN